MKLAVAWMGAALAAAPDAWLDATLEVVNPEAAGGRRLLTVGDLVGPEAQSERGRRPRVLVLVRVAPADCGGPGGLCVRIEQGLRERFPTDRLWVLHVVVPGLGAEDRGRERLQAPESSILGFDARGVAARTLGLTHRGRAAVVFSDGRRVDVDLAPGPDPTAPIRSALATGL